jgi:hypothetical protein
MLRCYAVKLKIDNIKKVDSQAIKVLQLAKFFREMTRQVVVGYVSVH